MLDGIGCATSGSVAPGITACQEIVEQLGSMPKATIIGSGSRTSVMNAAIVNSFAWRFLEYNDVNPVSASVPDLRL